MPERPPQLEHLEFLGDAAQFARDLQSLIPKCNLLEHFSLAEVRTLAHFMHVYRAEPAAEIIREGDGGDFMPLVVKGRGQRHKRDRWNTPQVLAPEAGGREPAAAATSGRAAD